MVTAGIRSALLTFEAQHLGYLRKDEARRCEIG